MERIDAYGYSLVDPGNPLERKDFTIDAVADDSVVVNVAGCGLCHTDVGFYTGQVQTFQKPVILGHETSGRVVAAGAAYENLVGKQVIIPAVLPCGECELCKKGRSNVCQRQVMPGNHMDGGFASHVVVPGRFLCELPDDLGDNELSHLSVQKFKTVIRRKASTWLIKSSLILKAVPATKCLSGFISVRNMFISGILR